MTTDLTTALLGTLGMLIVLGLLVFTAYMAWSALREEPRREEGAVAAALILLFPVVGASIYLVARYQPRRFRQRLQAMHR